MTDLLHHSLERAADRFGNRVAVRAGDDDWTFAQLELRANAFARHLRSLGVRPGDRVALMMANRVEFVIAFNAVSKLGAAAVLISPAWKAVEVSHAVELTRPVHAVTDGGSKEVLVACLASDRVSDLASDRVSDLASDRVSDLASDRVSDLASDRVSDLDGDLGPKVSALSTERLDVAVSDATESVLVFSSGTTGLPKAVRHTHRSMSHATRHWVAALGLGPDDRFQVATPPSHILGLLNLLAAAEAGASVRLHPRFDLEEILRRIESERMTLEMAVAPIALALANYPDLERFDLSSLRYIMWGATPVTEAVARVVSDRTGVRWLPAYGASELPVISANPVDRPDEWRLDSAGLAPDGVLLRVVDLETGAELDPGGIGEIQARSASLMAGYLPEADTAASFDDGWYRTGDVGWIESGGWVHLTDRSKEMLKVNGFQVAPAEIEAVLHGHPSVLDCAVFGLPDERAGEVPVAVVQLDPNRPVADGELANLVSTSLANYKQVRHVVEVDTIPRLPSGKVLRRTLRDEWTPVLLGSTEG